jgi:hypothetical protein
MGDYSFAHGVVGVDFIHQAGQLLAANNNIDFTPGVFIGLPGVDGLDLVELGLQRGADGVNLSDYSA